MRKRIAILLLACALLAGSAAPVLAAGGQERGDKAAGPAYQWSMPPDLP